MPALVEEGMSCMVSNHLTSNKNKKIVTSLFNKVGKTIWLNQESDLDKITAISGSGPAYFFLFIDYLESVAIEIGIKKSVAKKLVYQTALGSIKLLLSGKNSAKELKKTIAIKGGTTEAAVKVFEKNLNFKKIIKTSIKEAYKRSKALGQKNKNE